MLHDTKQPLWLEQLSRNIKHRVLGTEVRHCGRQSKANEVWVLSAHWGGPCLSSRLSCFCPKEPRRDSWEPSKSRQCGLTSWNLAESLSLGDPRRCPNKQKAAGKRWPEGQGGWWSPGGAGRGRRKSVVPGILGLWAVGSVASSWLPESRLFSTNSPCAGRPVPTTQTQGTMTVPG